MGKLISYEFRNSRKPIMQIVFIIMLASVILQYGFISTFMTVGNINNISREGLNIFQQIKLVLIPLMMIASVIVFFGASIVYYFRMANILRRDIFEDQGYIAFSIPRNGYQIIGSKLIVGTIWTILLPIIMTVWNIAVFTLLSVIFKNGGSFNEFYNFIFTEFPKLILKVFDEIGLGFFVAWITNGFLSSINFIIVIYTAIIVDYRLGTRKDSRRTSLRWVACMLSIYVLIGWISNIIFPSQIQSDILENTFSGISSTELYLNEIVNVKDVSFTLWMQSIYRAVVSALLFIYVAHNFEKKIEK